MDDIKFAQGLIQLDELLGRGSINEVEALYVKLQIKLEDEESWDQLD